MALNLSTLTNSATSASILNEALTTADLLDPVPILKNLARGSQKGGDAKQTTALNQPKALPLIKNPSGKLGGYLYIPNVTGNYATGPSVTIGANQTWQGELDMVVTQWGNFIKPMGGGFWTAGFGLLFNSSGGVRVFCKGVGPIDFQPSGITLGTTFNVKYGYDGSDFYADINDVRKFSTVAPSQSGSITRNLELSQQNNLSHAGNYAIQKAKLTVNSAVVFDCDFNGSTSIRHGDTKFQASVGGPVSLTRAGQDPVTVVKKGVLRFDGVNDGLQGLFNQTITDGYMFAAFSVLGNGGESSARVFSINSTGGADFDATGAIVAGMRGVNLSTYDPSIGWITLHSGLTDDANGDILHDIKFVAGAQKSRVNDADESNQTISLASLSAEVFNIGDAGTATDTSSNAAIDLEYLALFDATLTTEQANSVRSFINKRNQIYLRHQTDGYYFYDAQKAPVGNITDVNTWSGRIVGSDNGDSASIIAQQATANDQPVGDGYVVTFADNTDHLTIPSTTQAGWQVVGTSLGTFAYRVDNDAVTELNLLGNLGQTVYRKAGDLYGVILLPESATGADIEAARSLLIDRGAADGTTSGSIFTYWYNRDDIVEFKYINTSSVTLSNYAWYSCQALEKFPALDLSNSTTLNNAWFGCTALSDFGAIQADSCADFTSAFNGCSALSSFPAGAKLGTEVNYVDFNNAWRDSGLTSFPALDLSNGDNFTNAWRGTNYLTEIASGLQLGNNPAYTGVSFTRAWQDSGLTSFPALDLSRGNSFDNAWQNCSALTSFPAGAKLGTSASSVNFTSAWQQSGLTSFSTPLPTAGSFVASFRSCTSLESFSSELPSVTSMYLAWDGCTALTDFSADVFSNWNPSSISNGVFNNAWAGCSLTAQSVENILTSIDASGKYGTATGAAGGGAIDSGIDIDYDGTTLSAATNTAVDSLKSKGWSIVVNGVTL